MTLPDVSYEFYSSSWGGAVSESDFATALPHAMAAVRSRIYPNEASSTTETACRRAICAAVDVDAAWGLSGGSGVPSSMSAGTVSLSFDASNTSYSSDMARAIDGELVGTGLLFMGL